MKRVACLVSGLFFLLCGASANAGSVQLYVDTAPNPASAEFAAWETNAFNAVISGTFVNMGSGAYPGTLLFRADEAIVDGSGGRMLAWPFWIPDETYQSLVVENGLRFQVQTIADWDGIPQPTGWDPVNIYDVDLDGDLVVDGVFGVFGDAWAGVPDVASVAADMYAHQTYWTGQIRIRESAQVDWEDSSVQYDSVTAQLVPLPSAVWAGLALMGFVPLARRLYVRTRQV